MVSTQLSTNRGMAAPKPACLTTRQAGGFALAQVAIAEPPVLIVVEPWAGLDPDSRERIDQLRSRRRSAARLLKEQQENQS